MLPILTYDIDSAGAKVVWKSPRELRYSYSGKDLVKGWIGGLILLYAPAMKELLRVLLMSRSIIRDELKANTTPPAKEESKKGIYWIWWSCSKPANSEAWVRDCWDSILDFDTLQLILREYHPNNSGFYRISMTDSCETEESLLVSVSWMVKTELQYRVNIVDGIHDSTQAFGPNGSHRAKLVLQNKAVVPYFNGECSQGRWEMTDRFQKNTAYIASHKKGIPCEFSPCFSQISNTDEMIKR